MPGVLEDDRTDDLEDQYNAPSAGDDDLPAGHPSRSDLKNEEEGATPDSDETNPGRKWKKKRREEEGEDGGKKEKELSEDEQLNKRLSDGLFKAHDEDMAGRGKKKGDKGYGKIGGGLKGLFKRRKAVGGIGLAVIGLLVSGIGLFSFLNIFKLDHILQNIDASTFSKYNASFSNRSDKYLKAYIRMRLSEIEGSKDHDTLIFRANRVDTDNPAADFYRSLRTGSFEKKVFEEKGIRFTSIAVENPDGSVTLRPAQINFDGRDDLFQQFEARQGGKSLSGKNYLKGQLDADLSKFIDGLDANSKQSLIKIFDSDKDARREIRKSLKESTNFFRVNKRRHVRKDIQNMTGINDWRFFETTRNKITAKKVAVQRKIIRKIAPDNQVGKMIACILGAGKCVATNDPVAAENRLGGTPSGAPAPGDTSDTEELDGNGQPVTVEDEDGNTSNSTTPDYNAGNTADEIADSVSEVGDELLEEGAEDALTPNQAFMLKQVNKLLGNIYTKIWSYAKKLTALHNNITDGVFVKIVKQARLQQLTAIWATYGIARDQARTGQNTPEEMASLMETIAGGEHSEGWLELMQNRSNNVSAAEQVVQVANAKEYAKLGTADQKKQPIQYFLDRPSDSNAAKITEAYTSSFAFQIIDPIADVVNEVQDSFLGRFVDAIAGTADAILSKITDPLIKGVLAITGAQGSIEKLMGLATTKLMEFMGAGPIYDGTQAGQFNFLMAGSAAVAENSLRSSGGVKSTAQTTDRAKFITAVYKNDEDKELSVFDRYASLSNPKSVASRGMFSVTTFSLSERMSSMFSSIASLPSSFVSVFSGRSSAAGEFSAANWAGVDTFDISPVCLDIDPLQPSVSYLNQAVGAVNDSPYVSEAAAIVNKIRPELTMAIARDEAGFWDKVYAAIGDNANAENIAGAIYNCALLDQRVMGSMGYTSGYTNDNGYGAAE